MKSASNSYDSHCVFKDVLCFIIYNARVRSAKLKSRIAWQIKRVRFTFIITFLMWKGI